MSEQKLAGWAQSSSDPAEISNRVKGGILALSSVIIFVCSQLFGITLSADDVVQLATILSTIAGLTWSLYGAGTALVRWIATVKA